LLDPWQVRVNGKVFDRLDMAISIVQVGIAEKGQT
jgi:hypothetical protein